MNALVSGCSQRSSSTGTLLSSSDPSNATVNHFSSRPATLPRCRNGLSAPLRRRSYCLAGRCKVRRGGARPGPPRNCVSCCAMSTRLSRLARFRGVASRLRAAGGHDHDILERGVLIALALTGAHACNLVDDLHALRDAAKDRITVVARPVIEEGVVREVHEELRGGAVDIAGARHGQAAAGVLQPVPGFIADRRARFLAGEVGGQSAALDAEARHDAMKDGAVEMAVIDITQEILDRDRRLLGEQFHQELAV